MQPTREEVMRLAMKSGFVIKDAAGTPYFECWVEVLERFAGLIQDSVHVAKPLAESAVASHEDGSSGMLPCPFCNSAQITIRYEGQPAIRYAFACDDCGGTTGSFHVGGTPSGSNISFNNPEAIAAWNRRASHECGSVPPVGVEPNREGWFGRRKDIAHLAVQLDSPESRLMGDPSEDESLIACLCDDAAKLNQANPDDEMAATMLVAAARIEELQELRTGISSPSFGPNEQNAVVQQPSLSDADREAVLDLIAWLKGSPQIPRRGTSRGEAADVLTRLLAQRQDSDKAENGSVMAKDFTDR